METMMHRERIERLIQVMENLDKVDGSSDKLDLCTWGTPIVENADDGTSFICGTAACVAGWAAMDPELAAQGLHLRMIFQGRQPWRRHEREILETGVETSFNDALEGIDLGQWEFAESQITYDGQEDILAISNFFGMKIYDAQEIFYDEGYPMIARLIEPRHVVAKLRALLARLPA